MFNNSQMRMEAELEDMAMEYERTHAAAIITEKRGKNFDKVYFLDSSLNLMISKFYEGCGRMEGEGGRSAC